MQGADGYGENRLGATLSERQRECLRLVGRGMSSKEIALSVGLSPQTVDTYVKAAMARLGATNRREAARMLADAEARVPQLSESPSRAVDPSPTARQFEGTAVWRDWMSLLAPPPLGGRLNDLTAGTKTFAALRIAMIGTVVVIAIALLIAGALRAFA